MKSNVLKIQLAAFLKRILLLLGPVLLTGLTLAAATAIFFAWLAEEMLEGETQNFDNAARLAVHNFASPALTSVMRATTFIGSTAPLTVLGAGVVAAFYFARQKRAALLFLVTMAGAIVLNFVLKTSFRRVRPEPFFDTPLPSSYSFPSGHAFFSFCFFGILAALLTTQIKNGLAKTGVWTAAISLIFLIGLSRIYLGVHYPSDVIAGYAAALVWIVAVAACDRYLLRRSIYKNGFQIEGNRT